MSESEELNLCFHSSISEIPLDEWNSLAGTTNPFTRYEFLSALETNDCLGQKFGWHPYHLSVRNSQQQLVGVCPLYIKTNSYGEFVFDWSWASAYEQARLEYYPKLVCSIPYNPVQGMRLISQDIAIKKIMIQQVIKAAEKLKMSGMHWLFTNDEDTTLCRQENLALRLGCQYHWKNQNYSDFDDFISTFISRKRKKVKRERRMVQEQNITFNIVHGHEASEEQITLAQHYYESTFDKKYGIPTLSLEFFKEICTTMGQQLVFIFAVLNSRNIACAITLRSEDTLFGRFWGCEQDFHSLHFETCFYQGIEYCIEHKLQKFEPGAQGEHKISRGFLPTKTWSAHWIANPQFRTPIYSFCEREQEAMQEQCEELLSLSPYRLE
ncbi:MAG: GNAT family N-acetyltransferase [Pseudomonadota bacterium]